MENLHKDIRHLFYYDKGVYKRNKKSMKTGNMFLEFKYIMDVSFGMFLEEDWDINGNYDNIENDVSDSYKDRCICTHVITEAWLITHKPTGLTFQVGKDCVKKTSELLYGKLLSIKRKQHYKKLGRICSYCNETLTDIRKKHQKNFLCNSICSYKYKYVIPFGSFKGINMIEFLNTKRGQGWHEWIMKQRKSNKESFKRHPVFIEIVDETFYE